MRPSGGSTISEVRRSAAAAACWWRHSRLPANRDRPRAFEEEPACPREQPSRRAVFGPSPAPRAESPPLIDIASSPTPRLAELPEEQIFGERHAFEFEQLNVLFHAAVQRKRNLPRPRVDFGIFDGSLVHQVVRAGGRVPLDHMERVAV